MFSRPLLFFGVLVAAVVVPYVLFDEHLAETTRGYWQRLVGKRGSAGDSLAAVWHSAGDRVTSAAAGSAAVPLEQAFRFDLSPQWVTARWPRVSTILGDPQRLEMRVVLVTGTQPDDVAGSLTYYFDQHHQLQRISFLGLTADPRRLLAAVVTQSNLKSQPTTAAAHYIAGDPRQPTSEVLVRHLPIMRADSQRPQMEVSVNLRRGDVLGWQANAEREPEKSWLPAMYRRW
jgi:hypothetical protein